MLLYYELDYFWRIPLKFESNYKLCCGPEIAFEDAVCKISAILLRPQLVKEYNMEWLILHTT